MPRFKPTSVFILKRGTKTSKYWILKKRLFTSLYETFQKTYGLMDDKDRITQIEIKVTREK